MDRQLAGSARRELKAATSLAGIKALSGHLALITLARWEDAKGKNGKSFLFLFLFF